MTHIIENTNHPCYGMDCKECETCIFDVDLFKDENVKETCNNCDSLIKNYIGEDKLQFNACCGRCMVDYVSYSRPRNIQYKVGGMLDITTPTWCPKARGVTKEYKDYKEINSMALPDIPKAEETKVPEKKFLTYTEKRDLLLRLPKSTEWDDIEEGEVYVIPKILYQVRKVIRVVVKTDVLIRYSEIDEHGNENRVCVTLYKTDIDSHFITKLHKY